MYAWCTRFADGVPPCVQHWFNVCVMSVMPASQIQLSRRPMIGRRIFSLIGPASSQWSHGHFVRSYAGRWPDEGGITSADRDVDPMLADYWSIVFDAGDSKLWYDVHVYRRVYVVIIVFRFLSFNRCMSSMDRMTPEHLGAISHLYRTSVNMRLSWGFIGDAIDSGKYFNIHVFKYFKIISEYHL